MMEAPKAQEQLLFHTLLLKLPQETPPNAIPVDKRDAARRLTALGTQMDNCTVNVTAQPMGR
jgi:hypothetical protein